MDSVPLTHHGPKDLGLICLVKKRKIHFWILLDLRIQSWIFLKKRTLKLVEGKVFVDTVRIKSANLKNNMYLLTEWEGWT